MPAPRPYKPNLVRAGLSYHSFQCGASKDFSFFTHVPDVLSYSLSLNQWSDPQAVVPVPTTEEQLSIMGDHKQSSGYLHTGGEGSWKEALGSVRRWWQEDRDHATGRISIHLDIKGVTWFAHCLLLHGVSPITGKEKCRWYILLKYVFHVILPTFSCLLLYLRVLYKLMKLG